MGAEGRIGNRRALKGVADALQMEGVNRAPNFLNRDVVNIVQDLSNGGMSGRQIILGQRLLQDVSGVNGYSETLLDVPGAFSSPVIPSTGLETRVLAWDFFVTFNAAGALAFNGLPIHFFLRYLTRNYITVEQTIIYQMSPWATVATGKLSYTFSLMGSNDGTVNHLPCQWDGYVPSELRLEMQIISTSGANFPANTRLSNRLTVLQQPHQMRLHK